jgi:hypothetical protein
MSTWFGGTRFPSPVVATAETEGDGYFSLALDSRGCERKPPFGVTLFPDSNSSEVITQLPNFNVKIKSK